MDIIVVDAVTGALLNHDDLLELSKSDGSCDYRGLTISAASILEAITDSSAFTWEEVTSVDFQNDFGYHEVYHPQAVSALGFIRLPIGRRLTTSLEVALVRCMLLGFNEDKLNDQTVLFFYAGQDLPQAIRKTIRAAMQASSKSFFERNSTSSLGSGSLQLSQDRICRHVAQSYDYHSKKYGFLELFRAAETCFFASILSNVNSGFMSSPEKALKSALDSIRAESKAIKSVIDASQSNQQAEAIADTINQLRGTGNTFAAELFKQFERRTDKSDTSKTWRASCYLFSIRCSIAHAGQDGLVYEDFNDADAVVDAIFCLFEDIMLKSVGLISVEI